MYVMQLPTSRYNVMSLSCTSSIYSIYRSDSNNSNGHWFDIIVIVSHSEIYFSDYLLMYIVQQHHTI